MPAFGGRLSAAEIDAIADYVARVAGKQRPLSSRIDQPGSE
jgi:mono/diheme cytochrome c family protein